MRKFNSASDSVTPETLTLFYDLRIAFNLYEIIWIKGIHRIKVVMKPSLIGGRFQGNIRINFLHRLRHDVSGW